MKTSGSSLVAAVDVGGTTIKSGLFTPSGQLLTSHRLAVSTIRPGAVVEAVIQVVRDLLEEAERADAANVSAIGLAVPGVVDERAGIGRSSMMLGWRDVPFVELLQPFGRSIAFSHDVSAGAYGEATTGAAVGHHDWLFLAPGTGLGSTFILAGQPYRGVGGTGGELAHLVVRPDGPVCRCGKRGCLEMISSGPAIAEAYSSQAGLPAHCITAADVAARSSIDAIAADVWEAAVDALADAVAGYIEILNPSLVVVGGGLAEAGATLLDPLHRAVSARVRFADPVPSIELASHRGGAALRGVAAAARQVADRGLDFGVPFGLPDHTKTNDSAYRPIQFSSPASS